MSFTDNVVSVTEVIDTIWTERPNYHSTFAHLGWNGFDVFRKRVTTKLNCIRISPRILKRGCRDESPSLD